jgi:hypothetical protein
MMFLKYKNNLYNFSLNNIIKIEKDLFKKSIVIVLFNNFEILFKIDKTPSEIYYALKKLKEMNIDIINYEDLLDFFKNEKI